MCNKTGGNSLPELQTRIDITVPQIADKSVKSSKSGPWGRVRKGWLLGRG